MASRWVPALNTILGSAASTASTNTVCPWKGTASYYSVTVDGSTNEDAVWYYPAPKPEAEQIRDRVAFWHGVEVREVH